MTTVRTPLSRWLLLPLAPATVYVIALLLTAGSVIDAVYANADHSSNMFVAQALPVAAPGRSVVLGNIWWAEALFFQLLTRHLPDYRLIWEVTPWIFSMAAILATAWATARVADRWAGLVVGLTLCCSGSQLLPLQFAWNTHALAYANVCLLSAFTVLLVLRGGRLGGRRLASALWLALATLVFGMGAASDSLFEWAGLAPFTIACTIAAWRGPVRSRTPMLISTATVAIGSVAVSAAVHATLRGDRLVSSLIPVRLAAIDRLPAHLWLLARSIPVLMNGEFSLGRLTPVAVLAMLCAATTIAAICFACWTAIVELRRLRSSPAPAATDRDRSSVALARTTLVSYWVAGAVILALAFVWSNLAIDIATDRYLVTVAYAVVVIAAIGATHGWRRRLGVSLGASLLIGAGALAIARHYIPAQQYSLFPDRGEARLLARFARAHGLRYGYAAYWDAAPLTWDTNRRVIVYPTRGCSHHTLCAYGRPRISSWYVPRSDIRSFLIVDHRLIAGGRSDSLGVTGPPRAFGRPEQRTRIGALTVYVYGYDIASRFGRPINP